MRVDAGQLIGRNARSSARAGNCSSRCRRLIDGSRYILPIACTVLSHRLSVMKLLGGCSRPARQ